MRLVPESRPLRPEGSSSWCRAAWYHGTVAAPSDPYPSAPLSLRSSFPPRPAKSHPSGFRPPPLSIYVLSLPGSLSLQTPSLSRPVDEGGALPHYLGLRPRFVLASPTPLDYGDPPPRSARRASSTPCARSTSSLAARCVCSRPASRKSGSGPCAGVTECPAAILYLFPVDGGSLCHLEKRFPAPRTPAPGPFPPVEPSPSPETEAIRPRPPTRFEPRGSILSGVSPTPHRVPSRFF